MLGQELRLGGRLLISLTLFAHPLKIALGHFARRLRNALLFDGLRSILAGLTYLTGDLSTVSLLETLAGSVTVKDLLAFWIEFRLRPSVERTERLLFA